LRAGHTTSTTTTTLPNLPPAQCLCHGPRSSSSFPLSLRKQQGYGRDYRVPALTLPPARLQIKRRQRRSKPKSIRSIPVPPERGGCGSLTALFLLFTCRVLRRFQSPGILRAGSAHENAKAQKKDSAQADSAKNSAGLGCGVRCAFVRAERRGRAGRSAWIFHVLDIKVRKIQVFAQPPKNGFSIFMGFPPFARLAFQSKARSVGCAHAPLGVRAAQVHLVKLSTSRDLHDD